MEIKTADGKTEVAFIGKKVDEKKDEKKDGAAGVCSVWRCLGACTNLEQLPHRHRLSISSDPSRMRRNLAQVCDIQV